MITKKRVKKDVQVIETKKKYVTVYKIGDREYDTYEEAKRAMKYSIGKKLECLITRLANDKDIDHGYWQTMGTFYRQLLFHGCDAISRDGFVDKMNELIEAVNEYNELK